MDESDPYIGLARLESLLARLPVPPAPPRSLSIGCGSFAEYSLLANRWGAWLHVGLDWDRTALGEAQHEAGRLNANALHLPFACRFALILIRHPDVARYPQQWGAILGDVPRWLVQNGVLLITTFTAAELSFAQVYCSLPRLALAELSLAPPNLVSHDRFFLAYYNA